MADKRCKKHEWVKIHLMGLRALGTIRLECNKCKIVKEFEYTDEGMLLPVNISNKNYEKWIKERT